MEFGIFLVIIFNGSGFDYVTFSYGYWTIIEIGIITLYIKYRFIGKKQLIPFFAITCFFILGTFFLVKNINTGVTYCNFVLTIIADVVWLVYLYLKKKKMHWSYLIPFTTKLIADLLVLYVYFGYLNWFIDLLCILLPIVDCLFIILFFARFTSYKKTNMDQQEY